MTTDSTDIGPHDVLLGRGGATNSNIGNKRYRSIVAQHQHEYLRAKKKEKILIAKQIVSIVKDNGGRFLKRATDGNTWVQVPDPRATMKTSQALREGLDVRNKTVRPKKLIRQYSDLNSPGSTAKVVTGFVVSSPTTVSLSGDQEQYVPELRDEYSSSFHYVSPPINKADVDHVCEV